MELSDIVFRNQIFAVIWVVIWAVFFLIIYAIRKWQKQKKLELIHKERIVAMEKEIPLPELPDYELPQKKSLFDSMRDYSVSNPRAFLGLGSIFIMLGIGVSLAMLLSGDKYHNQVWSFGLIGIFLGLGLFLHYFFTKE